MHKLLERQLHKAAVGQNGYDIDRLCALVDAAYQDFDAERRLTSHAFENLQRDLNATNKRVRKDADARFNVIMDNVGEAVIIINEKGCIEAFNKAAENIFGYGASEVVGANVTILMTEADAKHHDETLRTYLRTGTGRIIGVGREVVAKRKSGETFPADLAIGETLRGTDRNFIGIVRDISARKKAEQELRESESRFRDLAGSASDWFWETDSDYRLTFVSERIATVLGVTSQAILGHTFFEIGLGSDNPALSAAHAVDIKERRPFRDVVFRVGPESGKDSRSVRISGVPLLSPQGRFIGFRGVGVDITREMEAEHRARVAQQQLTDAIESIVDGIAVYDADDRLVICNSQYRSILPDFQHMFKPGVSYEHILSEGWKRGAFNTDGQSYEDWLASRLALHRQASGKPFIIHSGAGRWILSREYRTNDGGIVAVRTDISQLKQREQELDVLRHRYELILDAAGEGIIGLGRNGRITFANPMAGQILGYSSEQMVDRYFHALVQHQDAMGEPYLSTDSAIKKAYRDGVAGQVHDDIFWRGDGTNFHVEYLVAPIWEKENLEGAVLIFRDATLRLRYEEGLANQQKELERLVEERTSDLSREVAVRTAAEAALRESRERLKGIADSLFDGVLVVDHTGQLVFANASARRQLSCDSISGDMEGRPLDDIVRLHKDGRDITFNGSPWQQVIQGVAALRDDDAIFATPRRSLLLVAYACSPLKENGEIRAAIISFRDIQALKQAQREALQASRLASVGQLAAGIAHEINTPVQYIGDNLRFLERTFAELNKAFKMTTDRTPGAQVAETNPSHASATDNTKLARLLEEAPVALQESLDGVAQIARIVLSVKEFSHPGTTTKTMMNINHAIENTLAVSRNTWKHVAEIQKNFDPSLPPILCHAGEMNQVFLNLVVNAAHAIEASGKKLPGTITVSTMYRNGHVEIRVADTGTGISAAIRDRIFDPFFTTKEVGKGTGQGLAICRDVVVTKHGGRIDVDGQEGEGAVFVIDLPIEEVPIGQRDSGE